MKVCESVNGVFFLKLRKSVSKIVSNCPDIMKATLRIISILFMTIEYRIQGNADIVVLT